MVINMTTCNNCKDIEIITEDAVENALSPTEFMTTRQIARSILADEFSQDDPDNKSVFSSRSVDALAQQVRRRLDKSSRTGRKHIYDNRNKGHWWAYCSV